MALYGKRSLGELDGNGQEAKRAADLFRGLTRENYMQNRVHRRLHEQAAMLGDRELSELGELSFNEQFPFMEQMQPAAGHQAKNGAGHLPPLGDWFGAAGREGYMQQRVHRKLHAQVALLSDQELYEIGKISFNEQFHAVGQDQQQNQKPQQQPPLQQTANGFSFLDRDAWMQQHVHRKLHALTAMLGDQDLLELGKLSFKDQFSVLGQTGPQEEMQQMHQQPQSHSFGNLGRDEYMKQRVHRRLHAQAARLSDQELLELGKLKFNEQFPAMGQEGPDEHVPQVRQHRPESLFGDLGREGFINQRVHRRLQFQAAGLNDETLFELGRLSFSEQFPLLGQTGPKEEQQQHKQPHELFGEQGRDGYLQQRVHRKLHSQAAGLKDEDLFELGKLSFNEQFPFLGQAGPKEEQQQLRQQQPHQSFGEVGREGYIQQRVHRRLHSQAAGLNDADLFELGKLSFAEQFPFLGQSGPKEEQQQMQQQQQNHLFGDLGRDGYMKQHVHRRIHAQAARLSDQGLFDLGKLSFSDQFPAVGQAGGHEERPRQQSGELFDGQGRDGYIQQRVHRRLHSQAAGLSDDVLHELGKLSFSEQFPFLGRVGPKEEQQVTREQQPPQGPVFGELGRDDYIQQRVHRKLHAQVAGLGDRDLYELGRLSFNEQFTALSQPGPRELQQMQPSSSRNSPQFSRGSGPGRNDLFRGMSRQEFMYQRVHKKLHARASQLSDDELAELGGLSFNDQFPAMDMVASAVAFAMPEAGGAFGSQDREAFMQQRVHRKLHSRASKLSDADLSELGAASFHDQFGKLDEMDGGV